MIFKIPIYSKRMEKCVFSVTSIFNCYINVVRMPRKHGFLRENQSFEDNVEVS